MKTEKTLTPSHEYLRGLSPEEKRGVAKMAGCSISTLRVVWSNFQRPSVKLAMAIDRVTKGKVKKEDLRPDIDWTLIVD